MPSVKCKWTTLHRNMLVNFLHGELVGLKFFNVYGPREAHKGAASSMIYQLYRQMRNGQRPRIFHDGEQRRDFIHVEDVVRRAWVRSHWLLQGFTILDPGWLHPSIR